MHVCLCLTWRRTPHGWLVLILVGLALMRALHQTRDVKGEKNGNSLRAYHQRLSPVVLNRQSKRGGPSKMTVPPSARFDVLRASRGFLSFLVVTSISEPI